MKTLFIGWSVWLRIAMTIMILSSVFLGGQKASSFTHGDPLFVDQWALRNLPEFAHVNIEGAWRALENKSSAKDIVIAVLDSGADLNHQDLHGRFWENEKEANGILNYDDDKNGLIDDIHGYNFFAKNNDLSDESGHGTHCVGIIAANHDNGMGIRGVFPQAKIMVLKIFDRNGVGSATAAAEAIRYAVAKGADIISSSWNGPFGNKALFAAIKEAERAGVILVTAAGNNGIFGKDNDITTYFPGSYDLDNIITVASHNESSQLSEFSHFGRLTVDIAAPGERILSTVPGDQYGFKNGTSMATPFVAGALGLLIALKGKISFQELRQHLLLNAEFSPHLRKRIVSNGFLSIQKMLDNRQVPHFQPIGWKDFELDIPFESHHPYQANDVGLRVVSVPGAKYIRVVFEQLELASGDTIEIRDFHGRVVELIGSRHFGPYVSEYIEGSQAIIRFQADGFREGFGYLIERLQWIP